MNLSQGNGDNGGGGGGGVMQSPNFNRTNMRQRMSRSMNDSNLFPLLPYKRKSRLNILNEDDEQKQATCLQDKHWYVIKNKILILLMRLFRWPSI